MKDELKGKIIYQMAHPNHLLIGYSYAEIKRRLEEAKQFGVDVSDLKKQMPELEKRMAKAEARHALHVQYKSPSSKIYSLKELKEKIQKAKNLGAKSDRLEKTFLIVEKKMLRARIEEILFHLHLYKEGIGKALVTVQEFFKKAEKVGACVHDLVLQLNSILEEQKEDTVAKREKQKNISQKNGS